MVSTTSVIKKDPEIERGGCRVESDYCIVDATIGSQFDSNPRKDQEPPAGCLNSKHFNAVQRWPIPSAISRSRPASPCPSQPPISTHSGLSRFGARSPASSDLSSRAICPYASIGSLCQITALQGKTQVYAEIVGFRDNKALLMPLGRSTRAWTWQPDPGGPRQCHGQGRRQPPWPGYRRHGSPP